LKNYKLLAADTSAKTATVALFENEVMLAEYTQNIGLTHSEGFLPLVEEVLVATKKDLSEIDYFAITNGPGSFTGLRIGVSTVKGLAHAVNKPLVEISTLDALAENIPHFSPGSEAPQTIPGSEQEKSHILPAGYRIEKRKG